MATYETLSPSAAVTASAEEINRLCAGASAEVTAAALAENLRRPLTTAPSIIIDSDIGDDPDDAAALSLLHSLVDRGECTILGTLHNTSTIVGAQALQAINTYYGRPDIPVGYLKDSVLPLPDDAYATALATGYPNAINNTGVADNATTLYRLLLANAPAASITILLIGYPRNLYHLYHSAADAISPLTGRELLAAKVARIVVMGGDYVGSPPSGHEHNFIGDATGVQVFNNLKEDAVSVVFAGFALGENISFDTTTWPASMPARLAVYTAGNASTYLQTGAWDLLATLYAVRGLSLGASTYFALSAAGKNAVDGVGNNTFTVGAGSQHYLTAVMSDANLQAALEAILCVGPATSGGRWGSTAGNLVVQQSRVGIGTRSPRRALEVNAADGYGVRIAYNDPAGSSSNYVDVFCGATGTAYIQGSGGKFATSNAINPSHAFDVTQTGTAGTMYCNQVFQGTRYKKAVVYFAGFSGSYMWTFPTPFVYAPLKYGSPDAVAASTVTTTQLTVTDASAITGWLILEGY